MEARVNSLRVYKELAELYGRRGQAPMRDRFLVLAADAAQDAGQAEEAERLRQRLLQANPHHLLKPYDSFGQALEAPDVQVYVQDLRANYPPRVAEELLHTLRAEAGTPQPLPPTAPVIDLETDSTLPLAANAEPLRVYPLRDEADPTVRDVPPTLPPQRRPAPRSHPPGLPLATPMAGPPDAPLARRQPPAPRPAPAARPAGAEPFAAPPPPPEPEPAVTGAWLSYLLSGIVFLAGLSLAVYTLGRPFWAGR
jgi:hypothetical protein